MNYMMGSPMNLEPNASARVLFSPPIDVIPANVFLPDDSLKDKVELTGWAMRGEPLNKLANGPADYLPRFVFPTSRVVRKGGAFEVGVKNLTSSPIVAVLGVNARVEPEMSELLFLTNLVEPGKELTIVRECLETFRGREILIHDDASLSFLLQALKVGRIDQIVHSDGVPARVFAKGPFELGWPLSLDVAPPRTAISMCIKNSGDAPARFGATLLGELLS